VEPMGHSGVRTSRRNEGRADPIDRWDPELRLRAIAHDMATPTATVRLLAELVAAESREEGAAARARVGQLAGLIVDEARQLDALRSESSKEGGSRRCAWTSWPAGSSPGPGW